MSTGAAAKAIYAREEICRAFLRGDCPRQYCMSRYIFFLGSRKVQVALEQVDSMADKDILQLVLKISEERGRTLCN